MAKYLKEDEFMALSSAQATLTAWAASVLDRPRIRIKGVEWRSNIAGSSMDIFEHVDVSGLLEINDIPVKFTMRYQQSRLLDSSWRKGFPERNMTFRFPTLPENFTVEHHFFRRPKSKERIYAPHEAALVLRALTAQQKAA